MNQKMSSQWTFSCRKNVEFTYPAEIGRRVGIISIIVDINNAAGSCRESECGICIWLTVRM